jgi:hypothetical protein
MCWIFSKTPNRRNGNAANKRNTKNPELLFFAESLIFVSHRTMLIKESLRGIHASLQSRFFRNKIHATEKKSFALFKYPLTTVYWHARRKWERSEIRGRCFFREKNLFVQETGCFRQETSYVCPNCIFSFFARE